MDKEIKIQRAWLEGLLDYAERVEKAQGDNRRWEVEALLGYILTAKTILKYE